MSQLVDIIVPQGEQQGTSQVLSSWLKHPGEPVTANMPLVDLETDKVMLEVAAPASGILKEVLKKPGEDVAPGTLLGRIEVGEQAVSEHSAGQSPSPLSPSIPATTSGADATPMSGKALLSPAVRRLVATHGLDMERISGSGRRGRITRQDVLAYLGNTSAGEGAAPSETPEAAPSVPCPVGTHVPHDAMRRRIAEHMTRSLLHTAPHVTTLFEMDLGAVIRHRQREKENFAAQGVKLTFTAYFVEAAVEALKRVPRVNSRFHADSLELFTDINIGVGTALEDQGLIVPVLHQAQTRNLLGIARELQRLTGQARNGTLRPADLQGGTFTLSNHGVSGSLMATPIIINQPQTAILGIGKMEKRVIVRELEGEDVMMIRPMAYATLTIDHRALDAYQANRFMTRFVEVIENRGD